MAQYSRREELGILAQELWRLRDALVRSTIDELAAPDVLRALRVLVLDANPLLVRLADYFRVGHDVPTISPARPPAPEGDVPELGSVVIPGMVVTMTTDPYARWRAVRGEPVRQPIDPPLVVSFSKYLALGVAADAERLTPVSRRDLLWDTINEGFVAHASTAYAPHVEAARTTLESGRHYVELAEELAFETLLYGDKVLATAVERMGISVESLRTPDWLAPRQAQCAGCGRTLDYAEFKCPVCDRSALPPYQPRTGTIGDASRATRLALGLEVATLFLVVTLPLFDPAAGAFIIIDAKAPSSSATLYRTADMRLIWEVARDGRRHVAELPLDRRPVRGDPNATRTLMLGWNPDRCMVEVMAIANDMWASSDGVCAT